MWKTILRRLLIMIPQLIILSLLVFLLAKMMPGDPFSGSINPNTDPKQIEALKRAAGLYDPWSCNTLDGWVTCSMVTLVQVTFNMCQ